MSIAHLILMSFEIREHEKKVFFLNEEPFLYFDHVSVIVKIRPQFQN